jgi:hypothetical protein
MTTNWMAIVGAPALVAPLVLCTSTGNTADSNAATKNGLVRVNTQTPATFDADAWKERLRANDLEAREHDFERLIGEARDNDAARKQLEAWAHDDSDANLAWTSRLALRELGSSSGSPFSAMPHGSQQGMPWNDLRSRMDDLQSRFGGLDSMFEDLQREMDQAFQGMPMPGQFQPGQPQPGQMQPGQGGFSNMQSKSYSMQVDPDGVKVEVSQDVNGKKETQTYTAKSLDELYAAHPELKDQLGVHVDVPTPGGLGRMTPQATPFGSWHGLRQDDDRPAIPLNPGAMRKDVLGVRVSTPTDQDRSSAKLDAGVGLKVESVQPGTIASRIGVQPGDLVVDINGHAVKSVDDVRSTLGARKDGEDVAVTVVDDQGQKRVLTWRASSERQL